MQHTTGVRLLCFAVAVALLGGCADSSGSSTGTSAAGAATSTNTNTNTNTLTTTPAVQEAVVYTPYQTVVAEPSTGDPYLLDGVPQVVPQTSNNNLTLGEHDGRYYFAFRTAPSHFASGDARLYVLSAARTTAGAPDWEYETEVHLGRDLREPLFLSVGGRLILYLLGLGTDPLAFEPGPTYAMERDAAGNWSAPQPLPSLPGFADWSDGYVVWRVKTVGGVHYLLRYRGGHYNLSSNQQGLEIEFLKSTDGYAWQPVDPARPVVYSGGGSEADFGFDADGNLLSVIRVEDYDAGGYGARICWAPAGDIANWQPFVSHFRYDSPLVFSRQGNVYLLARRSTDGEFDKGDNHLPIPIRTANYLAQYSATGKRTALYRFRLENGVAGLEWLFDFDGMHGDTAFPGLIQLEANRYLFYNYSSKVGPGLDKPWLVGQLEPTYIYSTVLEFTPQP